MKRLMRCIAKTLLIGGIGISAAAVASTTIKIDPNGAGNGVDVGSLDWLYGNAINFGGNPPNGLVAGSKMVILSQARLNSFVAPDSSIIPVPAGKEFTFVYGIPVVVTSVNGPNSPVFMLDTTAPPDENFLELWVKDTVPLSDDLAGTGFNVTKRILWGHITNVVTGTLTAQSASCPGGVPQQFDQFHTNDYPGVLTVCAGGSTQFNADIITLDADYFPGFTQAQIDQLVTFFNSSNIAPFHQADPSKMFVSQDAGSAGTPSPAPDVSPKLGTVNGAIQTADTLDFQNQADANQAFQPGTEVAGTCRVTYGGNDKNGNVDPAKFGSACSSDKGKAQNCYTFGGQVGAPTADPLQGGPFGEHTHHNVSGPAGDFVFRAGTHSAPKSTRITATACKDPDACQPAAANAKFKQIDFEGTGTFRTLDPIATSYLSGQAGHAVVPDNQDSTTVYYFRVDMDDLGEPGNQPSSKHPDTADAKLFFNADQNYPLATADPSFFSFFPDKKTACTSSADVYQILICRDATPCGPGTSNPNPPIYAVRGFLTGGNIQIHPIIK
jgi:hypothetical protein